MYNVNNDLIKEYNQKYYISHKKLKKMQKQTSLKTLISNAKTIPLALYCLALINIVLFIGIVIRELSVIYLIGSFVYITLLITLISMSFNLFNIPTEFFGQNVKFSL